MLPFFSLGIFSLHAAFDNHLVRIVEECGRVSYDGPSSTTAGGSLRLRRPHFLYGGLHLTVIRSVPQ